MPSQHAIVVFAFLQFAIIGLSLLIQPLAWAQLIAWLRREGEAGAIACGLSSLLFGALIVSFHRVWVGFLVVLTLVGWLHVIRGLIFLIAPSLGLRLMGIAESSPGLLRLGGLVSVALAVFIFVMLLPGGL